MTVIAYRDGIMAGDSCWSGLKGRIETLTPKVFVLPGGALYGGSGAPDDRALVERLSQVTEYRDLPTSKWLCKCQDYGVVSLFVLPNGRVFIIGTGDKDGGVTPVDLPYTAVGSGGPLAIGAMATGLSAVEAVKIACDNNIYCRPPITTVQLGGRRVPARRRK